jgi:hypothetical protein
MWQGQRNCWVDFACMQRVNRVRRLSISISLQKYIAYHHFSQVFFEAAASSSIFSFSDARNPASFLICFFSCAADYPFVSRLWILEITVQLGSIDRVIQVLRFRTDLPRIRVVKRHDLKLSNVSVGLVYVVATVHWNVCKSRKDLCEIAKSTKRGLSVIAANKGALYSFKLS